MTSQLILGCMCKYAHSSSIVQLTSEAENDEQCSAIITVQLGQNLGPKQTDSSEDASDDNATTVPTPKGGMRRKHHRAWSLAEVMKLIEGVSKCGAGRWSEIKRLAFASYSYRTSVDLKVLPMDSQFRCNFSQIMCYDMISRLFMNNSLSSVILVQDKWRNLLKASLAQTPPDEGVSIHLSFSA